MSEVYLSTVPSLLEQAGHHDHARKLRAAGQALEAALDDERDDAPDWRPRLDAVRQLQMDGLRLLDLPVPGDWGSLYPPTEASQ